MNVTILLEELIQHQVKLKVNEGKLLVQLPEGGIDAELLEKLKQHKEAIRLLILDAQKPRVKRPVITKRSRVRSREVLSHMQQRLWVLDQIEGSAHYNISNALVLEGNLDTTVFRKAFNTILERHEVLRTVYEQAENGQVYQVIQDVQPLAIVYDNLSGLPADVQQEKIRKIQQEDAMQPFDLGKDVLIRVRLVQQDAHAHVVLVTMHHIATDGWSIGLLIKEFCALYAAYSKGAANPLPALPVQYADYAVWQQEWLKAEQLTALKNFWSEQLKELPPVHSLPLDFARPAVQTFRGDTFYTRIDPNLLQQLQRLCEQEGTTLFAGLYTVFTLLLARYSNENDIVIGTPVANREQPEVAALVGLFMNMIVLRTRVAANVSFIDLLRQNRQLLIDSYAHQQLPFDMLVGTLQQERNAGYSALFQVMMVLQNNEKASVELPGVALRQMGQVKPFAMYDLSLIAEENRNGLTLGWEYNTDLFKAATIRGMAAHFEQLLASLLAAPEGDAMQANMMPAEELQLLSTFNDTEKAYPVGSTVIDLFKEQVAVHPEKILVSYEDRSYTIAVLDEESDRLAAWLNVKQGDLVGIQLDRSEYMLLAILAVLKAGAGYVPIGMDYPEERVNYIKQDAQLVRLIDAKLLADFKEDAFSAGTFDAPDPGTNAYAIYTSGSTGQPKGVINDHAGLYNRLLWMRDDLGIGPDAVIMQKTPYTFDVSVWELLMPLITGCKLVFAAPEGHKDPHYIQELIAREQVSIIHFVPSMLGIFLEELDSNKCRSLRHVVCSGEALPSVMVEAFKAQLPWVRIHNLYGPTEAAIDVTSIDLTDVRGVSIGKPVANTKIHIVDKQLNLQPIGVAGELLIEGVQVARGYLNQPALTASKFIERGGKRVYRTGDLAKWLPDGTICYMGRMDDQVKIRGNRIEPGEIESCILGWGHAEQAGVVVKGEGSHKYLLAYVVPGAGYSREALYSYLGAHLPEYMVPGMIMELETLPLTSSGKLNRRALPEPVIAAATYTAPGNEVETALAAIWKEVLGVDQVSIHDNFFRIGGDSIMAIRLVSRINKHFNTALSIPELYNHSTIAAVGHKVVSSKATANEQAKARNEIRKSIDNLMLELQEED